MNWFVTTYFCDQTLSTPVFYYNNYNVYVKYCSVARNIRDNDAFANLAKNFSKANKSWFTASF